MSSSPFLPSPPPSPVCFEYEKHQAGPEGGPGAGNLLLSHIGDLPPPPPLSAAEAVAAGLVPMVSTAPAPMETVPSMAAAAPVGGGDAMLGVGATPEALAMAAAAGAVVPVVGSKCAVADCVAPVSLRLSL